MMISPVRLPEGINARLAEFVAHLSGCNAELAVDAVHRATLDEEPETEDERLAVVAEALILVRRTRTRTP